MSAYYVPTEEIEGGAHGTVYLGEAFNDPQRKVVAIKVFQEAELFEDESEAAHALRGTPYFLQLVAGRRAIRTPDADMRMGLVYELAQCDLSDYLLRPTGRYPHEVVDFVVQAVNFMRANNIVHRDIKVTNILHIPSSTPRFKFGDLVSVCRIGPSDACPTLPLLTTEHTHGVRTTYIYIPKPLESVLTESAGFKYHTSNIVEEVLWIDLHCALTLIADVRSRYVHLTDKTIEKPSDPLLAICHQGMLASTYAECEAAWDRLSKFVNATCT